MSAWSWATGATSAAAWLRPRMNPSRSVLSEAKLRATGWATLSSGGSWPRTSLTSVPRAANMPPYSARSFWMARRTGSWKRLKYWSMSTGSGRACESPSVPPAGRPWSELPGVSSRYLRPTAERARTSTVVSSGIGLTLRSSCSSATAIVSPLSGFCSAWIDLMSPTRTPAMRTSFPTTSDDAEGSSTRTG